MELWEFAKDLVNHRSAAAAAGLLETRGKGDDTNATCALSRGLHQRYTPNDTPNQVPSDGMSQRVLVHSSVDDVLAQLHGIHRPAEPYYKK
jgi:hypothetical protein